jgi:hypothetical protein
MKSRILFIFGTSAILMFATALQAEIKVVADHNSGDAATAAFKFANVPSPSRRDAASVARFAIVDGRRDTNGGRLDVLRDGAVPSESDEPAANFFFAAGSEGGRLLVDLGGAGTAPLKRVNTYSWHANTRGPQVYNLYAADGKADGFTTQPKRGTDPATCGWKLLAKVDTRSTDSQGGRQALGGQYGVTVFDPAGPLGAYRYLLFDVSRTEADDPFGNTFFSEIDVDDGIEREAPATTGAPATTAGPATSAPQPRLEIVEAEGGYRLTIDTTETPDLTDWARTDLAPVVREWYPKIVAMLPSDGFEAPRAVTISISSAMRGVAATGGTRVRCAATWFRQNLQGEAKGAVVHELVHVVQQYGAARRANPAATRTPGWLVEGMADYIRWFLYEPQTHGADIATTRALSRARYDSGYRVSGNFLNWAVAKYDKDIVRKLNAAAREGTYTDDLWQKHTGHSLEELNDEWKKDLEKNFAGK